MGREGKIANLRWRIVVVMVVALLVGCYNRIVPTPNAEHSTHMANMTLAQLRDAVEYRQRLRIDEDVVIEGRVVSSDAEDNLRYSLYVEDEGVAIEVMAEYYPLHALYPEGQRVELHLLGTMVVLKNGLMRVGHPITDFGDSDIEGFASRQQLDRVIVACGDVQPLEPLRCEVEDLEDRMCGRLVEIDSLTLVDSNSIDTLMGESLSMARWQGCALFTTPRGDSLAVYTDDASDFAHRYVVERAASLRGILQHRSSRVEFAPDTYQLVMRYESDCVEF